VHETESLKLKTDCHLYCSGFRNTLLLEVCCQFLNIKTSFNLQFNRQIHINICLEKLHDLQNCFQFNILLSFKARSYSIVLNIKAYFSFVVKQGIH
jgi:hypothetical protein